MAGSTPRLLIQEVGVGAQECAFLTGSRVCVCVCVCSCFLKSQLRLPKGEPAHQPHSHPQKPRLDQKEYQLETQLLKIL